MGQSSDEPLRKAKPNRHPAYLVQGTTNSGETLRLLPLAQHYAFTLDLVFLATLSEARSQNTFAT